MIETYDLSVLNLQSILQVIEILQVETHGLVNNGISSYNVGMPILDHSELYGLRIIVLKYIEVYRKRYNIPPVKLINSWFNITNPGGELKKHKHEESIISGAFYVSVGKNTVPLIFSHQQIKPQSGLLILFSSDLEHHTDIEQDNRVIISFNAYYL
jgi:hypothetical protein